MTRTARDEIWSAIIEQLVEDGRFMIRDLPIEESKAQTVRRVCREMEEMGYLYRLGDNPEQSKTWRAGPLAKELLDLEPKAEVMADLED